MAGDEVLAHASAAFRAALGERPVLQRLWTGGSWVEGPAWLADRAMLVFSEIPSDRMLAWHEAEGRATLFRAPANSANGNTVDREGRLVTCEQRGRRIVRQEADGSLTVLAERCGGARFNSPNDVVVDSAGGIWFTDPAYGEKDHGLPRETDGCHVYRAGPDGGVTRVITDMVQPNGLAFSPDEALLYVIDTGSTHVPGGPNHVRVFSVADDWSLTSQGVLHEDAAGKLDGLRVDRRGWLWLGTGEGLRCIDAGGALQARIAVPERVANLAFGGIAGCSVYLCATSSLYRLDLGGRLR